ncbi:terminase large subunit domain-containing protein [Microbispora bryophytorum]|uniref:terminase large subunit domain-containing protein n=1 Tax=Microbispora bryophytorum TaxID=1460882 RepID=UPI0033F0E68F
MPWQQYVADVALEIDPKTGLLAYREVVLTVPRQSGKTTLLLAAMVHRALGFGERQRVLYTAQNRISARKKWEDEHVATLLGTKEFKKLVRVRRQLGQEAIVWKNGSTHGIESNTDKAGHGETLDMGVIDEAFAQEDDRLEQAFKPAMITRPQPQLWVLSTAGTSKSTYLRSKVDAGRAQVASGLSEGVCYFEWSAPPDSDPGDPETWWACMPALGHTVTEEAVASFYESMKLPEFRRAFLNQWPDDAPDEWIVIKQSAWNALEDATSEIVGNVAFAVDVTPDRKFGSIAVVGKRADGLHHVEIVAHQGGTGWIAETVRKLHRTWKPVALVIDASGPAGSLIGEIESLGIEVVKPTVRDVGQACGQFYDAVVPAEGPPTLRHIGQPELNAALAGASKRQIKDVWAWNRRGLSVDISPLVAVTSALWGFTTKSGTKKQGSRPKVAFL